jgi:hypothetical protein
MFAQWHDRLYGSLDPGVAELSSDESPDSAESALGSFFVPHLEGSPKEWEASTMSHFLVYDGTDDRGAAKDN